MSWSAEATFSDDAVLSMTQRSCGTGGWILAGCNGPRPHLRVASAAENREVGGRAANDPENRCDTTPVGTAIPRPDSTTSKSSFSSDARTARHRMAAAAGRRRPPGGRTPEQRQDHGYHRHRSEEASRHGSSRTLTGSPATPRTPGHARRRPVRPAHPGVAQPGRGVGVAESSESFTTDDIVNITRGAVVENLRETDDASHQQACAHGQESGNRRQSLRERARSRSRAPHRGRRTLRPATGRTRRGRESVRWDAASTPRHRVPPPATAASARR